MSVEDELLEEGYTALVEINEGKVEEVVNEWIEGNFDPVKLVNKLAEAMAEVGKKFESMEYFLPQVMIGAEIMEKANKALSDKMAAEGVTSVSLGTVVLATVEGDIHDLGKNLVGGMLKTAGFNVVDLGTDVPASKIIAAAKENNTHLIAASALMSATMSSFKDILGLLDGMGIRDQFKLMIGGAPITQEYADEIGADYYAQNAAEAVEITKKAMAM
ncbi:cobalamin B12-binding domain-containing protein [Methanococcoides sp. LMO-2]|uniref:Cobalamin-dependent protein n=1 Tax=Methanococcoides cohabitans TaxID=3136559 RepID=A0ABU9KS97_9EURY